MTNTLENGHWIEDNKLDNLINENSLASTMDRNNLSTLNTSSNQQGTNGTTHHNNQLDEDDDSVELDYDDEINEQIEDEEILNEPNHTKSTYTYTGHLGTTDPIVLKHIGEAIDNVVKNFQINKADLVQATTSTSSSSFNKNSTINEQMTKTINKSNSKSTKSNKSTKQVKKKNRNKNIYSTFSFDNDQPFELNASKRKKPDNKRKDNQIGPFIRIEQKKNQTNYIVVNSTTKIEDKDNLKLFNKPNYGTIARTKSTNQILFKHNDQTWICIFCKRQPHFKQLGDLFGPHELIADRYLDTNDDSTTNGLCSPSTSNFNDNLSSSTNLNNSTKIKNEIWFHEDCIIWSNGIYLAGNRVRNIDEVVLECSEITCCACKLKGANLGCIHKGCNQTFHFICAKESGCELIEESYSMFCQNHKKLNNS